ncbi:hypothetical protein FVE85_7396 [Porphyridium purpureum]|uniref:RAB6-interacting golgin n=1 Tax=Porphyridium purpureum TaxID=35688 RepID=A0A5J4Z7A0_PORPP|nr:hypothetical protein FVE85_7396 [Porphyridium purpureum]|eukprot:POR0137..scf295_1
MEPGHPTKASASDAAVAPRKESRMDTQRSRPHEDRKGASQTKAGSRLDSKAAVGTHGQQQQHQHHYHASSAQAAELVKQARLQESERRKQAEDEQKRLSNTPDMDSELELEEVSKMDPGLAGMDDNELFRRQRALQEKLEVKHMEYVKQAKRLQILRQELKDLEEPLKREIFAARTRLEEVNKDETRWVNEVNGLRKQMREAEKELQKARSLKQECTDSLVTVMADYEKKKEERLEQIALILGEKSLNDKSGTDPSASSDPAFSGF